MDNSRINDKKACNVTFYNDKQVFVKHQIGNLETWKIIF